MGTGSGMVASSGPSGVIIEGGVAWEERRWEEGDVPGGVTLFSACLGAGPILDIEALDTGFQVPHVVE